ncbi:MAG: hypothetical protein Q4Q04_05440 [Methanocorpusculum sp.]|nr:hypothetical protein [Methanocorpusculum sp.]
MKAFPVFCIIMAALFVLAAVALGFAGIGVKTASGAKAAALEEQFGVELMQITCTDGTKVPVVRTAEGDYLNAYDFINAFHGKTTLVTSYVVENGQVTEEKSVVITFNIVKDPSKLKDAIWSHKPSLA